MREKEETIQGLIAQLINAMDPEEICYILAKVNRLSADTSSSKERMVLYHHVLRAVRIQMLELAEGAELTPITHTILSELNSMRKDVAMPEEVMETDILLDIFRPCSAALEKADSPEEARHIVQTVRSRLRREMEDTTMRQAAHRAICSAMESEVLARYLEEIRGYDKRFDQLDPQTRYLASLLCALEAPAHPSLALSFLRYDMDKGVFYSIAPAELSQIEDVKEMESAIFGYHMALQKVEQQEAVDCAEELKYHIPLRFALWLKREKLTEHTDIRLCVYFLEKVLKGTYDTEPSWSNLGTLPNALDAISTALYLAGETDVTSLERDCAEHAEHLLRCGALNHALAEFTVFGMVYRLCGKVRNLNIKLPPALECLMRLYLSLCLSSSNTLALPAYTWAMFGGRVDSKDKN